MSNLFEHIPAELPEELVETLLDGQNVRIERIVSKGHRSPEGFWYDQDADEWVLLLTGRAKLRFEDAPDPLELRPGDSLHIPAHRRHRVDWTDPEQGTVWLAIHFK